MLKALKRKDNSSLVKRFWVLALLIFVILFLATCTAGPNELKNTSEEVAGFWKGLWHGLSSGVVFIISLFNKNVNIYEVHNNGNWYNFGFILGVSIIFGGSGGGAGHRFRKNK